MNYWSHSICIVILECAHYTCIAWRKCIYTEKLKKSFLFHIQVMQQCSQDFVQGGKLWDFPFQAQVPPQHFDSYDVIVEKLGLMTVRFVKITLHMTVR